MSDDNPPALDPHEEEAEAGPGRPDRWTRRRRVVVGLVAVALVAVTAAVLVARHGSCPPAGAALKIEGRVVSADEVERRSEVVEALYGLVPPEGPKLDSYRRELAKSMATAELIKVEAVQRKIVVADRAVRDALDRYIADSFPDTGRAGFVKAMGNKGVSEAEVLAEFAQIQTTFRLLEEVTKDVAVSDADVTTAFTERRDQMVLPEHRRLRHLVVATEAEAQAALKRLRGGAAFPAVAMAVSLDLQTKAQGGELGSLTADQLDDAFRRAAFAAAPGQLFGPVQTRFGWHVGLVEEVTPSRPLTLDEARGALHDQLLSERKLAAQRAFVAKALRNAHVCYAPRFRPADPKSPPPTDLGPPGAPGPSSGGVPPAGSPASTGP